MPSRRLLTRLNLDGRALGAQLHSEPGSATLSDKTTVVVNNKELHLKFTDLLFVRRLGKLSPSSRAVDMILALCRPCGGCAARN